MIHTIKCYPQYFARIHKGEKKWELRNNDRNYKVGELVYIQEFIPETCSYTGRIVTGKITHVTDTNKDADYRVKGLEEGYVILDFEIVSDIKEWS